MAARYDAIVVGARCAGAPTALLLARKGYRVLLVDKATFPSDTISTHVIQPNGIATLARWGLLDRLIATGCPPIHTYSYDFGPFAIAGSPGTQSTPFAYCPRRSVLDKLLIDAAAEAGAEVREGFGIEEVVVEGGRVVGVKGHATGDASQEEHATVVVGADGRRSRIAEAVRAEAYNEKPPLLSAWYAYWSELPMNGRFETYVLPRRGFAAAPTHNGLTFVVVGWPYAEHEAIRSDIEGNHQKVIQMAPSFAERFSRAKRETPFAGAALPNFFRKPFGPGWALVGDAGYNKDAITAQGISDAFRDAELCANAIDLAHRGECSFATAMEEYQRRRDECATPMYEFTCELASFKPPSVQQQQLLGAVAGNRQAEDDFARVNAGTNSPAAFFAPDNVNRIMTAAGMTA